MRIFITLICYSSIFLNSAYAQASDWNFVKNKNGIKIYTHNIPNSNLKKIKATMEIDAEFSKLVGLIENIAYFPHWMHDVTEARLVKKISDIEQYAYIVQAAAPVKSRDFIVKALVTQDPKTLAYTINVTTTPHGNTLVPSTNRYVRMTDVDAYYKFTPLNKGKRTAVELAISADPAGKLPSSLINLMAVRAPYNTLMNIKKLDLNRERFIPTCVAGFDILDQECRQK